MIIKTLEHIRSELLGNVTIKRNFPKTTIFKFDDLYREIVTQIRTVEISSECVLFDSVKAVNENKEYADMSYWSEKYKENEIRSYWFFAQNGQGDLWLFDADNKVYFYNHDLGEFGADNFTNLNIDFSKWLQFAYLNKDFDKLLVEDKVDEIAKDEYKNGLSELSGMLLENYPF
jgi:hypothetical protein